MKTCTKCGETKPLDDFYRNRGKADGRDSWCRECAKERRRRYYEENRDKERESQRRYREENRDKLRECDLRYREENRAYRCAIKRANDSESQSMSAEMSTIPPRTPWAEDEDAFLMADNGMTGFQKAIHLGRTYASCRRRRHRLRQAVTA